MSAEEAQLDLLDFVNARVFGNPCFRPQQREVVDAVMAGRNVFVLMPTGGGASYPAQPLCERPFFPHEHLRKAAECGPL